MALKLYERRRYIRIEVPLDVVIRGDGWEEEIHTKNISPIGLSFQISRELDRSKNLEIEIHLPASDEPIRLWGKIAWQERASIEDNAPYNVGVEITDIEETKKNTLLKYLCDLLYASSYNLKW